MALFACNSKHSPRQWLQSWISDAHLIHLSQTKEKGFNAVAQFQIGLQRWLQNMHILSKSMQQTSAFLAVLEKSWSNRYCRALYGSHHSWRWPWVERQTQSCISVKTEARIILTKRLNRETKEKHMPLKTRTRKKPTFKNGSYSIFWIYTMNYCF